MKLPRICKARVDRFPVVRLEFDDGLAGEIDHSADIESGRVFLPLRDPEYFRRVAVSEYGHSYGWNLEECGREIDFGADTARTIIETNLVHEMAGKFRHRTIAAE